MNSPPRYEQGFHFSFPTGMLPSGTREEHFSSNWFLYTAPSIERDMGFRLVFATESVVLRDMAAERLGIYLYGSSHTPPTHIEVYEDVMISTPFSAPKTPKINPRQLN